MSRAEIKDKKDKYHVCLGCKADTDGIICNYNCPCYNEISEKTTIYIQNMKGERCSYGSNKKNTEEYNRRYWSYYK
jgi:hypothetical protein